MHLMAIHYHYAVHEALGVKEDAPVALTKREREVMLWTTEGKTAWEISTILECTERTVNAHLKNAMDKMGGVFEAPRRRQVPHRNGVIQQLVPQTVERSLVRFIAPTLYPCGAAGKMKHSSGRLAPVASNLLQIA